MRWVVCNLTVLLLSSHSNPIIVESRPGGGDIILLIGIADGDAAFYANERQRWLTMLACARDLNPFDPVRGEHKADTFALFTPHSSHTPPPRDVYWASGAHGEILRRG